MVNGYNGDEQLACLQVNGELPCDVFARDEFSDYSDYTLHSIAGCIFFIGIILNSL